MVSPWEGNKGSAASHSKMTESHKAMFIKHEVWGQQSTQWKGHSCKFKRSQMECTAVVPPAPFSLCTLPLTLSLYLAAAYLWSAGTSRLPHLQQGRRRAVRYTARHTRRAMVQNAMCT